MTSAQPEKIVIKCKCGGKFRVAATAVGKKAKCPKCSTVLKISAPSPKTVPAPLLPESDDFLTSLAEQEGAAETEGPPLPALRSAPRPAARGGGKAAATGFGTAAGLASGIAKSAGGFALGIVLSAVGGVIGGVVWYLIAVKTDYEIGYVALGVGFLAGAGMLLGYRQANAKAGLVAALIAVAGILGAKFALVTDDLSDYERTHRQSIQFQMDVVQSLMTSDSLASDGVDEDSATEQQMEDAWTEAGERIAAMSEEDVRAAYKLIADNAEIPSQVGAADKASGLMSTLGPFDVLWLVLAVLAAWRLGNNGFSTGDD